MGGAFGALARYGVAYALKGPARGFPWPTLLVNITGAFGLSLLAVVLSERLPPRPYVRPLVGIGFYGAYTTFSTMAVEGVRLVDSGRAATAVLYWVMTLLGGLAAGVAGMWVGRVELPGGDRR